MPHIDPFAGLFAALAAAPAAFVVPVLPPRRDDTAEARGAAAGNGGRPARVEGTAVGAGG